MKPRRVSDAQAKVKAARGALVKRDYAVRLGAKSEEERFRAEAAEILAKVPAADLEELWPDWEFDVWFGLP